MTDGVDAEVSIDVADADNAATFNEQLSQLEAIVAQLEGGQLELEDSLKRYGEGVELIRALQGKLIDAEQKVQLMMGEIHEQE
ncbi:MAG: exodeoxyribonuclease VII small subunit [Coriobacteriia bacterium]|nr:exodeoxyribonuclease VII small subunit [Coriobacteriia bacterium]